MYTVIIGEYVHIFTKPSKHVYKYLSLCFTEGGGYDPWGRDKNFAIFLGWLKCYNKPEMKNMGDHTGRTVFYQGDPGPMVPKGRPSKQLLEVQD